MWRALPLVCLSLLICNTELRCRKIGKREQGVELPARHLARAQLAVVTRAPDVPVVTVLAFKASSSRLDTQQVLLGMK